MRRVLLAAVCLLAGLALPAVLALADHGSQPFAGKWKVFYAPMTSTQGGEIFFRHVPPDEGRAAVQGLRGQPCSEPTDYYRGEYLAGSDEGTMAGCTVGAPGVMAGAFASNLVDGGAGTFDIRLGSPTTWAGAYHYFGGSSGDWNAEFEGHFPGDGAEHPSAHATTATQPPPPPPTTSPTVTTNTVPTQEGERLRPALVSGNSVTLALPRPGDARTFFGPQNVPPRTSSVELTIAATPAAIRTAQLFVLVSITHTHPHCVVAGTGARLSPLGATFARQSTRRLRRGVGGCTDAVERHFEGATASVAQASTCGARLFGLGRRTVRRPPVKVSCARAGSASTRLKIALARGLSPRRLLGQRVRVGLYRPPAAPASDRRVRFSFRLRR
jgi:hypothetical protein